MSLFSSIHEFRYMELTGTNRKSLPISSLNCSLVISSLNESKSVLVDIFKLELPIIPISKVLMLSMLEAPYQAKVMDVANVAKATVPIIDVRIILFLVIGSHLINFKC